MNANTGSLISEQTPRTSSFGNRAKLWKESETTLGFVSRKHSFSKDQRFKLQSIYWPQICNQNQTVKLRRMSQIDELASKISKNIDQQEKNEMRFKKEMRGVAKIKNKSSSQRKEAHSLVETKKPFKLSNKNQQVLSRLTQDSFSKQSTLRDRHGNRCNMFEDPELDENCLKNEKQFFSSTGFKTSRKIKLELPHNYYPGPGTYKIKRFLQKQNEFEKQRSQRQQ